MPQPHTSHREPGKRTNSTSPASVGQHADHVVPAGPKLNGLGALTRVKHS